MHEIVRALAGEIVMSPDLEALADSLYAIQVPESWMAVSYPSLKPLGSYVTDLKQRLEFLQVSALSLEICKQRGVEQRRSHHIKQNI